MSGSEVLEYKCAKAEAENFCFFFLPQAPGIAAVTILMGTKIKTFSVLRKSRVWEPEIPIKSVRNQKQHLRFLCDRAYLAFKKLFPH